MTVVEAPRQIVLEARVDEQNLVLIEKVFQNSRIKTEMISKEDPIRLRIPATTRAVGLLLILLEELAPKGKIILDDGSTFDIDEEGLSKLRRLAIRSLSNVPQQTSPLQKPRSSAVAASSYAAPTPKEVQEQEEEEESENIEARTRVRAREGSESNRTVAIMTLAFLVIVGIVIGSATWLAISGRIGEISSDFILGACIVGTFSVIHRYASGLKSGRA